MVLAAASKEPGLKHVHVPTIHLARRPTAEASSTAIRPKLIRSPLHPQHWLRPFGNGRAACVSSLHPFNVIATDIDVSAMITNAHRHHGRLATQRVFEGSPNCLDFAACDGRINCFT
jgi:hypothetical protein